MAVEPTAAELAAQTAEAAQLAATKAVADKATADKEAADKVAADAASVAIKLAADEAARLAAASTTTEVWPESGDAFVDSMAKGFLAKGGTSAAFEALLADVGKTGTLTAAAKVALTETFGDLATGLIPTIEAKAKENLAWVTTETNAVYAEAGDKAQFEAMQAWSKANLDDATRDFLTSSLQLGGASAKMAVQQLRTYMEAAGATVKGPTATVDGAAVVTGAAYSLVQYMTEHQAAQRSGDAGQIATVQAKGRAALKAAESRGAKWR
jgi:hypothetical protein